MFFWQTLIGCSILVCCLVAICLTFSVFKEAEYPLVTFAKGGHAKEKFGAHKRYCIAKDLLYSSPGGHRMQMRVQSRETDVIFEKKGKNFALVEKLHGVKGMFQEKLFYSLPEEREPMQTVCFFEAEQAYYHNKTGKICADQVKMKKFNLPGHQYKEHLNLENKVMEGECEAIQFCLLDHNFAFSADGFHMAMYDRNNE